MEEPVPLCRCCAEAQADGVPCPTLGRSCEVCERALRLAGLEGLEGRDEPLPIRPPGWD